MAKLKYFLKISFLFALLVMASIDLSNSIQHITSDDAEFLNSLHAESEKPSPEQDEGDLVDKMIDEILTPPAKVIASPLKVVAPDGGHYLTFGQLSETKLDLEKLPPEYSQDVLALKDKEITILGFVLPLDQIKDAKHFMLMKHPKTCYYCNSNPTLLDLIYVRLKKDVTTSLEPKLVKIKGVLKLLSGSTPFKDREQSYENMLLFNLVDSEISVATEKDKDQYIAGINKLRRLQRQ